MGAFDPRQPSPCRNPAAHLRQPRASTRRPRSRTLTELDSPPFAGGDPACYGALGIALAHTGPWATVDGMSARRDPSGGSAISLQGHASDSAYGTLDDLSARDDDGDDDDDDACEESALLAARERGPGWRDRVEASFTARSRRRVQAAVGADGWQLRTASQAGDGLYWRRTLGTRRNQSSEDAGQSSPEVAHEPIFTFDLAYDADSSFDSLNSLFPLTSTLPSTSTSLCSSRSSPEPSECGESDSAAGRLTMVRRRRTPRDIGGETTDEFATRFLSRRHTLPRRHKTREPGRKVSFSSLKKAGLASSSSSAEDLVLKTVSAAPSGVSLALPPLFRIVVAVTSVVSLASLLSPSALVLPVSPVHLRHTDTPLALAAQLVNAALAPFLVQSTLPALVLAAINLHLLRSLDASTTTTSARAKAAIAATTWGAVVGLRALSSWVFGRALGWAHPQFLSTRAVHEVGAGLAPLLLALYLVHVSSQRDHTLSASAPALLGASFLVPVAQGGTGLWFGICAALVGVFASIAAGACRSIRPYIYTRSGHPSPKPDSTLATRNWTSPFLAFLLLPSLALYPSAPTRAPARTDLAFSQLHPADATLVTVLLMTAPRPGNPDFLLQTVESWLGAFPEPDPAFPSDSMSLAANSTTLFPSAVPTSSRLRLVVYTHFAAHPMFDLAQAHFASSDKAAHYISWQRDPRALEAQNRLDQRLHVARGLDYAASLGGAYVLLTEDDFPLCEDARADGTAERSWRGAWEKLQAALVATNERMPDTAVGELGHCGLFLATGGSGLAIRTALAARLPALLLGADDPHGYAREVAAARGEIALRREGEGADTPDLVIQDCLRGRLAECAVCAPAAAGPAGSARHPSRVDGERVGKSGLAGTERLLQRHLGYNASTLPGRMYGREEWACGWRQPFNGEPDVLTV